MNKLAGLAQICILATLLFGCEAPGGSTANISSPPATLGKWVPSCTDSSVDAKRLMEDIRTAAPALLHAKNLSEEPLRGQALTATAPLAACSDKYVRTEVASELPPMWQTSSAERFAELISERSTGSPSTPPSNAGCPACQVTGKLEFTHPTWGEVRLETYTEKSFPTGIDAKSGYRIVSRRDGHLLYDKAINDHLYELSVASPSSDGFMFVTYNPGRYNGVIVLKPTDYGVEDFGTDSFPRTYNGRFYNAKVQLGSNPTFSITLSQNNCMPSCAAGNSTDTKFVYDEETDDLVPS
jgi:hypothetical protein